MNTTSVEKTTPLPSVGEQIKQFIASGAWYRQITGLLALAGVLTLGIGMILFATQPTYVPIYSKLNQQDAIAITDALQADNIPYKIETGGMVLVPADQVDQVRMKLAASGLPSSGEIGIEMLQKDQGLGTSRFIENARYHHALETELSRTISSMQNIDTARVHLAMPKQSVFIRKQAKPTASVMVKLMPGRSLASEQTSAIVHLVASSIPYMEPDDVTIVDQWGRLLSSGDDNEGLALSTKQFEYTRKLEDTYGSRIEELLTPILGAGRVRAKVNAEIDFTYNESTREAFDGDPNKLVRSEQTQEQASTGNTAPIGIPGALSNQPPGAGTTDPNQAQGKGNEAPKSTSAKTTRNYELDKTITHSKAAPGQLRRLSVAVLVDDQVSVNEAGESVRTPLSEEQIATLTNIVKEAIGFDAKRGDSVAVFNQSFQPMEEITPVAGPALWEQPWVWAMLKQILIGVAVLLLVLFVAKPAVKALQPTAAKALEAQPEALEQVPNPQAASAGGLASDQVSLSHAAQGTSQLSGPPHAYGEVLDVARGVAAEDPKRVAKVIKDWVNSNA